MRRGGVAMVMPCAVDRRCGTTTSAFVVSTSDAAVRAQSLVIATGGLTVPKIGATPFGYRVAEQFGLRVVPPRPALVPLAFDPARSRNLAICPVFRSTQKSACKAALPRKPAVYASRTFRSGDPANLVVLERGDALAIDLLPGGDAESWLESERKSATRFDNLLARTPAAALRTTVERRARCGAADQSPRRSRSERARRSAACMAQCNRQAPSATTKPKSRWAVSTPGFSSKTMAATTVPGLYFIGEVVDVTGWLGGYNFQWAWASGHAAGQHA